MNLIIQTLQIYIQKIADSSSLNISETSIDAKKNESNDENIMEEITKIEIPRYEPRKENVYKKADTKNPWGNVVYNDSDEEILKERDLSEPNSHDFLKECDYLREVILGNDEILSENNENENIMINVMKDKITNITSDIQELQLVEPSEIEQKDVSIEQKDIWINTIQKRYIIEEPDKEYLLASACTFG